MKKVWLSSMLGLAAMTASATLKVVAGRPYRVTVALNGHKPIKAIADGLEIELPIRKDQPDLADLFLESDANRDVEWTLPF